MHKEDERSFFVWERRSDRGPVPYISTKINLDIQLNPVDHCIDKGKMSDKALYHLEKIEKTAKKVLDIMKNM